jgi:Tfp pilus assembly protein PilE
MTILEPRSPQLTPANESGLGIVELLVAAIILIIGTLAVFTAFDASTRATSRSEGSQVAQDLAQQELEKIHALNYGSIALTSQPAHSSNAGDPRNRVNTGDGTFALSKGPPASDYATMVVNGGTQVGGGTIGGGVINPGPQAFPFTSGGDIHGQVFRYVVWRNDPGCLLVCPGNQDFKRVIVVVKLDDTALSDSNGPEYIEVHSDFVDPQDSIISDTPPGGGSLITAQQFWLTDTPCSGSGTTTRMDIAGDHALHNTLGKCSDGAHTGSTAGAPDTLLPSQAPDLDPDDPGLPLQYDYSNDTYLEPSPNTDKGVQIVPQDITPCSYNPSGSNPQSKIHRWVTDPMTSSFVLTGSSSLYFFSRTINQAVHQGKLCAFLFIRSQVLGIVTDTPILNLSTGQAFFTYLPGGTGNWPSSFPSPANKIPMTYLPQTVLVAQRLGIAVSVDHTTPASLEFMYDHPDYATRLEVSTTTPIG